MTEFIMNNIVWFWVALMVLCVVVETLTVFSLTTVWGAVSSLVMIFLCRTGMPFAWQILIFLVLTIVLVLFTRPVAVKKLRIGSVKTNVDQMIGQEVVLTKGISKFEKGEAKTSNGVIWSVTSADGSEIESGTVCVIEAINGNTLSVQKK